MKLHQPLKNTKSNSRPNNGILLVSFCYWSTCIVFQCTLLGVITSVLFFFNIAWWGHFALYTSRCVCALRFFHHLKCSYFQSLFSAFGEVLNSNPTDSTLIFVAMKRTAAWLEVGQWLWDGLNVFFSWQFDNPTRTETWYRQDRLMKMGYNSVAIHGDMERGVGKVVRMAGKHIEVWWNHRDCRPHVSTSQAVFCHCIVKKSKEP